MRALLLLIVALAWLTSRAEARWASAVTLWDHAAIVSPSKPRVLLNAGVAHFGAGDVRGACPLLKSAEALGVRPFDEWGQTVHLAVMINLYTLRTAVACP